MTGAEQGYQGIRERHADHLGAFEATGRNGRAWDERASGLRPQVPEPEA
jgi:hypothetical protein